MTAESRPSSPSPAPAPREELCRCGHQAHDATGFCGAPVPTRAGVTGVCACSVAARSDVGGETPPADEPTCPTCGSEMYQPEAADAGKLECAWCWGLCPTCEQLQGSGKHHNPAACIRALRTALTQASRSLIEAQREREELRRDAERWRVLEYGLFIAAQDKETGQFEVVFQNGPLDEVAAEMRSSLTTHPTGPVFHIGAVIDEYIKRRAAKRAALAPTERTNG